MKPLAFTVGSPRIERVDIRARRVRLGSSPVEVSRLCLGLGSSGCGSDSLQGRLSTASVSDFLLAGLQEGITWWDTADNYGSQRHVREALGTVERRHVQITSKTHARTSCQAEDSVERMLGEMACGYLDVLLLHEVDSLETLRESRGALDRLHRFKEEGLVRAVGLSTHCIEVLEAIVGDPSIDVLLTNYNLAGIHMDADRADYERALEAACSGGQGACAMKTLGEGALADRAQEAIRHNLEQRWLHGVLVGVISREQVLTAARVWKQVQAGN